MSASRPGLLPYWVPTRMVSTTISRSWLGWSTQSLMAFSTDAMVRLVDTAVPWLT
jgi:hypothetical protein